MPAFAKEASIDRLSLAERIYRRAYELYVQRGNQSRSEIDDWLLGARRMRRAGLNRVPPGDSMVPLLCVHLGQRGKRRKMIPA